jgi:hypothetical protein
MTLSKCFSTTAKKLLSVAGALMVLLLDIITDLQVGMERANGSST